MSSFLSSFSSEFRSFSLESVTFAKNNIGQTQKTYAAATTITGILFVKTADKLTIINAGKTELAQTQKTALMYLELTTTVKT